MSTYRKRLIRELNFDLNEKRVLEIGSDKDGKELFMLSDFGAKEVVGINPLYFDKTFSNSIKLFQQDSRSLEFPEKYFDLIVSFNVFEHINELDKAIEEMYRVLKVDGALMSDFGPIWDSPHGHHIQIKDNDKWIWHPGIPDNMHLEKEKFEEYLSINLKRSEVDNILYKTYESKVINRLTCKDYRRIVENSKFYVEKFENYSSRIYMKLRKYV